MNIYFVFFTENLLYISESGMIIPDLTFYEFRIQEKALEWTGPNDLKNFLRFLLFRKYLKIKQEDSPNLLKEHATVFSVQLK